MESIRAARLKATRDDASSSASATDCSDHHDGDDGGDHGGDHGSTSTDTPECIPMAVAAWTKCCEEANLRERGQKEDND